MERSIRSTVAVAVMMLAVGTAQQSYAMGGGALSETARLAGSWDCTGSVSGSTSSQLYRRINDTTLTLALVMQTASGVRGDAQEKLKFDRASGVWSLDAGKNRFYDAEHLEAPAWAGRDWLFTGTETTRKKARPVRIKYSYVVPDTFVREREVRSDTGWTTDGVFVCTRAALEGRYDSGEPPPENQVAEMERGADMVRASPNASAAPLESAVAGASPAPISSKAPRAQATTPPFHVALGVSREQRPRAAGNDRAYDLTRGIWDCSTFGGAHATHTYTREGDDTIKLHNVLRIAKHDYAIDEYYRYDRSRDAWKTTTLGEAYAGVAGKWLTDRWVFNGEMPLGGHRVPVQMVYSTLGERAFRRDFVREQNGAPATFAAETCQLR